MEVLLVAVNAKFIHSALAPHSIKAYCGRRAELNRAHIRVLEFTINNSDEHMLSRIFKEKPEIIGFSCYIWNVAAMRRLARSLRKLMPDALIVFGGPEAAGDADALLLGAIADIVVTGRGERAFSEIVGRFAHKKGLDALDLSGLSGIGGIAYLRGGRVVGDENRNQSRNQETFELPFPYPDGFDAFKDRIVYYEASRGCPFCCAYCLSAGEELIARGLGRVYDDLSRFLAARVPQVKFVDRTFNFDKRRAADIWAFLMDRDNGVTNFHFEIRAELLDDGMIALLSGARPGQFQFEIGVQSTNPETLECIRRPARLAALYDNVNKLRQNGNIHLHLDLIAGLPKEGCAEFARSFDDVYALRPDQLQLGFLKLLKNSPLSFNYKDFGIVCGDDPPYEVLYTGALAFEEICRLKDIARLVEIYHNSGSFARALPYAVSLFQTPFRFFEAFAAHWSRRGFYDAPKSRLEAYSIFLEFGAEAAGCDPLFLRDLLKLDIFLSGRVRSALAFLDDRLTDAQAAAYKAYVKKLPSNARDLTAVRLNYDMAAWLNGGGVVRRDGAAVIEYDQNGGRAEILCII